eukprot:375683-Hanusia_phi.AAC.2
MRYGAVAGASHGLVSAPTKLLLNAHYSHQTLTPPTLLSLQELPRLLLNHWPTPAITVTGHLAAS